MHGRRAFGALLCLPLAAGCARAGCLRLAAATSVLARADRPVSSRPAPVVATLPPGEVLYRRRIVGKDYVLYEVAMPGGRRGYVLGDTANRECRAGGDRRLDTHPGRA